MCRIVLTPFLYSSEQLYLTCSFSTDDQQDFAVKLQVTTIIKFDTHEQTSIACIWITFPLINIKAYAYTYIAAN